MKASRGAASVALALALAGPAVPLWSAHAASTGPTTTTAATDPRPVLAYYYIWFSPESWERAKKDLPLLGAYSSDDRDVLRHHVRLAKAAGITGFAVSWKATQLLERRLELLMEVAREEKFTLAIVYQGLDFHRDPLPVERIAEDLDIFKERYASDPVFDIFGDKPLVIWSGTWEFDPHAVELVTRTRREDLLILGTERSVKAYERLAPYIDGNAYYWSSVNPDTYPDYPGKLRAMSDAIKAHKGLWVAPVAPGFDARMIGGKTVVERHGDFTLRRQWEAALSSDPDALGLISWNEFSENSHVEPSRLHGDTAIRAVANLRGTTVPASLMAQDSSDSGLPGEGGVDERLIGLGILVAGAGALTVLTRRRRRAPARPDDLPL